jgi:hypothetical protein
VSGRPSIEDMGTYTLTFTRGSVGLVKSGTYTVAADGTLVLS